VSFGTTPPPNPVRGHFWFDGTGLAIFDGAAWVNTTTLKIVPPGTSIGGGTPGGGGTTPGQGTVIISATAPGNPVAGMQWWDGSQLRMWDGTVWQVIGPGAAVGPVPTTSQVFRIGLPNDVTIPADAYTIVPFTTQPSIDTLLGWNATTKQYRPTRGGMYLFFITGQLQSGGTAGAAVLAKNDQGQYDFDNTETVATFDLIGSNIGGVFLQSGMAVMNGTTDFVRLFAWSGAGVVNGIGTAPAISAFLMP